MPFEKKFKIHKIFFIILDLKLIFYLIYFFNLNKGDKMEQSGFGVSVTAGPAAALHLNMTRKGLCAAGAVTFVVFVVGNRKRIRESAFIQDRETRIDCTLYALIAAVATLSAIYITHLVHGREFIIKKRPVLGGVLVASAAIMAIGLAAVHIYRSNSDDSDDSDGNTTKSKRTLRQGEE
jgi:hypothetical protein